MERVHTLINKLQEQYNSNQNSQQLLASAQLLVAELSGIELPEQIGKVSVWMPSVYFSVSQTAIAKEETNLVSISNPIADLQTNFKEDENIAVEPETVIEPELTQIDIEPTLDIEISNELNEEHIITNNAFDKEEIIAEPMPILTEEIVAETTDEKIMHQLIIEDEDEAKEVFSLIIDEELEDEIAPTLAFQTQTKESFEINDMGHTDTKSVNEILKEDKKEVATTIVETPIKDLRKAIGINDKYRFINELFQGDENSYERSVKTINGFSVYPEAEHWIKRELHTKLCWVEDNEAVKHFDQLVRRRFLLM